MTLRHLTLIGLMCLAAAEMSRGEIHVGGDASGVVTVDLESFSGLAGRPGTVHSVLRNAEMGVTFGEKLVGQVKTPVGDFDDISGGPSVPLAIDASVEPEFGVNVLTVSNSTIIVGLGDAGFPLGAAVGEGSLTALFDEDQRFIAFDLLGTNGGAFRVQFFDRLGGLLGDLTVPEIESPSRVFSSDEVEIAAITVTNLDYSGMGFDNFRFSKEPLAYSAVCDVNGPYQVERTGEVTNVAIQGPNPDEPEMGEWELLWLTDCPFGTFDDRAVPTPTLSIDTASHCSLECSVTLLISNGLGTDVCSGAVIIDSGGSPIVCPADTAVEADGLGNVEAFEAWLDSAVSDDPTLADDFVEFEYACSKTGQTTVTWWTEGAGGGECGGATECSAMFTIVDSTPPTLELPVTEVFVENLDCLDEVFVELPEALASDTASEVVDVSVDAPELFPAGQTTTVTYTATDECGNAAQGTLDVTVGYRAGIEVHLERRVFDQSMRPPHYTEALADTFTAAYDFGRESCARDVVRDEQGLADDGFAAIVANCESAGAAVSDENGVAIVDVPSGQYIVVGTVDWDDDGVYDGFAGKPIGDIDCGQWKTVRLTLNDDVD